MAYKVGILDKDEVYARELMLAINSRYSDKLTMVAFANENQIQEYVQHDKLKLLICSKEFDEVVGDVKRLYSSETREKNYLYKYQKVSVIVSEIEAFIQKNDECCTSKEANICVFSPSGRSGKTNLALGICRQLQGSIYIGYEICEAIEGYCKDSLEEIDNKILFYILSHNEHAIELLQERIIISDGCAMLFLHVGVEDILQIDRASIIWLLEKIRTAAGYKSVVYEPGVIGKELLRTLDIFDSICITELSDLCEEQKLNCFFEKYDEIISVLGKKIKRLSPPFYHYSDEVFASYVRDYVL